MNYISSNLKYLRLKNNITQKQIAEITDKSLTLVSQWESDDRNMQMNDIIIFAKYFNIPMEFLINRDFNNNEEDLEFEIYFYNNINILTNSDKTIIKKILELKI